MGALVVEWLPRPVEGQDIEGFVEEDVALVEVDAQREELRLQVAGADAEYESAVRQLVDGGGRLRQRRRIPVRQHGDIGEEPQPGGHGGDVREGDEGIETLMTAGGQPCRGRGRVFGEGKTLPTGPFGRHGQLGYRTGVEHVAIGAAEVRILEDELHPLSHREPVPAAGDRWPASR